MIRINLLPIRKKIKEQNIRYQITVGVGIIVLSVFVLGYLYSLLSRELNEKEAQFNDLDKENTKLDKVVGDINKFRAEKKALKAKLDVIDSLSRNRLMIVKILDEISRAKPEKLWLTKLEQSEQKGTNGDLNLKIQGRASSNEVIAQFMINLQKYPLFTDVDLLSTKQVKGKEGGVKIKQFDITSKVALPKEKKKSKKASKKDKGKKN